MIISAPSGLGFSLCLFASYFALSWLDALQFAIRNRIEMRYKILLEPTSVLSTKHFALFQIDRK